MSLSLASTPVTAAICPALSMNLLNRMRASTHDIEKAMLQAELPVTVSFLGQAFTILLSFIIVDRDFGFEMVLGTQWEAWCTQRKVPCPLPVVDVPADVYPDFSSRISEDLQKEFQRLEFLHTETVKSSPIDINFNPTSGGIHDLQKIENCHVSQTSLPTTTSSLRSTLAFQERKRLLTEDTPGVEMRWFLGHLNYSNQFIYRQSKGHQSRVIFDRKTKAEGDNRWRRYMTAPRLIVLRKQLHPIQKQNRPSEDKVTKLANVPLAQSLSGYSTQKKTHLEQRQHITISKWKVPVSLYPMRNNLNTPKRKGRTFIPKRTVVLVSAELHIHTINIVNGSNLHPSYQITGMHRRKNTHPCQTSWG